MAQQLQGKVKKIYVAHIDKNTWRVLLYGKAGISTRLALLQYYDHDSEAKAEDHARAMAVIHELKQIHIWEE